MDGSLDVANRRCVPPARGCPINLYHLQHDRKHLVVTHFLISTIALSHTVHFLIGPFHTTTFLGHFFSPPHLLVDIIHTIHRALLLGVFFLTLATFVQLGWAVNLKIMKLKESTIHNNAVIGCGAIIFIQAVLDIFVVLDNDHEGLNFFIGDSRKCWEERNKRQKQG